MSFEWKKINKVEENFILEISASVFSYIKKYYKVSDITKLTEKEIQEVINYRDNKLNQYSVLYPGFIDVIQIWKDSQSLP